MSFTFGSTFNAKPQQNTFGQPQQSFGFSSGQATNQQQPQPAQATNTNTIQISKYTKYNDLPQDVQQKLNELHKKIQEGKLSSQKISTKFTASQLKHLKSKYINDKLIQRVATIGTKIKTDLDYVKGRLRTQLNDLSNQAEISLRVFDAMVKNGGPGSIAVSENALGVGEGDPIWQYFADFSAQAEQDIMSQRMTLQEIESQVQVLVKRFEQGQQAAQYQNLIPNVLKSHFDALLQLSQKTAQLHQQVEEVTALYGQWRKVSSFKASFHDPVSKLRTVEKENAGDVNDLFRKSTFQEMSRRIAEVKQNVSGNLSQTVTQQTVAQNPTNGAFSFGTSTNNNSAQPAAQTTGFNFGTSTSNGTAAQPSTAASFAFGGSTAATGSNTQQPQQAQGASGFNFGGTATSSQPTAQQNSVNFGSTTQPQSQAIGQSSGNTSGFGAGLSLNTSNTAAPSFSFGGFGKK